MLKDEMRAFYLKRRRQWPAGKQAEADRLIIRHLLLLPELKESGSVVAYLSDGGEPELRPLLRQLLADGKQLYLPRFAPHSPAEYELVETGLRTEELCRGRYGITEPAPSLPAAAPTGRSVWLIPGVAFDRGGNRLGRGKGVYDRLLAAAKRPLAVGVFYSCQEAEQIPANDRDYRLDVIVTEGGIIRVNHGVEHE